MPYKSFDDTSISRAERFQKVRKYLFRGMSREKVGQELGGIPKTTINNWEKGRPIANHALGELEKLGVSMAYLLRGSGKMMLTKAERYKPSNMRDVMGFGEKKAPAEAGDEEVNQQTAEYFAILRDLADMAPAVLSGDHPELAAQLISELRMVITVHKDGICKADTAHDAG